MFKSLSRAGHRRPVFFLALVAIAAAAACYSSDYRRTMAAYVALLSDLSDKLADYCRSDFKLDDRQLSSEEMGEFYYAFNKANAFSSSTPRESSRASHRDFVAMLNAYERFAHAADGYRLSGKADPAVLATLLTQRDQVKHLAGKVTEDLRAEAR
ncbi:MAG TPA: hypothetical protein VGA33_01520 [Thermoanaerobaculia bacterium]